MRRSLMLPFVACGLAAATGHAQTSISLDGSLPHGLEGPIAPIADHVYEIPQELGHSSGENLFHSFLDFDLDSRDSAIFTAESEFARVIARVTGGEASRIDGALVSQVMADAEQGIGADFYLLNPHGLLFGPSTSIDVPAGLYLSTAQELHFEGGDVLELDRAPDPVLSIAAPEAFGFRGGGAIGEIVINGAPEGSPTIQLTPHANLTVAAGRFEAIGLRNIGTPGGLVQIGAVGSATAVVPLADITTGDGWDAGGLGEVVIRDQLALSPTDVNDPSGDQGRVVIRGGRFELAGGAKIEAGGNAPASGAGAPAIDISVTGELDIDDGASLSVNSSGGPNGELRLEANTLRIRNGAIVQSNVGESEDGGGIRLDASSIEITEQGQLLSSTQGTGSDAGHGSELVLDGDQISIRDGGVVASASFGAGDAGDIRISADALEIDGGQVFSLTTDSGAGGDIELGAREIDLHGDGTSVSSTTEVPGAFDAATPGGDIRITASGGSVRVRESAVVHTLSAGTQAGGEISIDAATLDVTDGGVVEAGVAASGAGGAIALDVGELSVANEARIATAVGEDASGAAGDMDITAGTISLDDGGQISSTTFGDGDAGAIGIDATGVVSIGGASGADETRLPSGIFSRSETNADGNDVRVSARSIFVEDGAEISTRARGTGRSGTVTLDAVELVRAAGTNSVIAARGVDGSGGNVVIDADRVEVLGGGSIDVSTSGAGTGGLLTVTARDVLVSGGSTPDFGSALAAQADGTGDAVGIEVTATERVRVENGGRITALSRGLGGSPGDIRVAAPRIEISGGTVTAQAGAGTGGNITLTGANDETPLNLHLRDGAEITARSQSGGDAGTIAIVARHIEGHRSRITADSAAFGGNVDITTDFLLLEKSTIAAFSRGVSSGGPGPLAVTPSGVEIPAGGNLTIEGGAVILNQARLDANGFGNANGGFIDITADPWLRSGDSAITASSEFGLDGFVLVNTPYGEVTGDLAALPETFLDASSLLEEPCLARDAPSGSFAVQRAPRVSPPPDAPLSAAPAEPQQCEAPPAP